MTAVCIKRTVVPKGALFTFEISDQQVQLLFLNHALERMNMWQLTLEMVAEALLAPEEVLIGHHNRFIAHKCFGEHVLRAVYEYDAIIPVLVTVYFPYKKRYFQGGGCYEDTIFPRR